MGHETPRISLPVAIGLVPVSHGPGATQGRVMLVADTRLSQCLTKGRFREPFFARQRQLAHVDDQVNTRLLEAGDESIYGQALVAEGEKR